MLEQSVEQQQPNGIFTQLCLEELPRTAALLANSSDVSEC